VGLLRANSVASIPTGQGPRTSQRPGARPGRESEPRQRGSGCADVERAQHRVSIGSPDWRPTVSHRPRHERTRSQKGVKHDVASKPHDVGQDWRPRTSTVAPLGAHSPAMVAGHNVAPTVHTVVTDQLTGRDIWKGKRGWASPKVRCVGGAYWPRGTRGFSRRTSARRLRPRRRSTPLDTATSVGLPNVEIGGAQSIMRGLLLLTLSHGAARFGWCWPLAGGLSSEALYRAKVNHHNHLTSHNERDRCSDAFSY
jgi:hypothetical protein